VGGVVHTAHAGGLLVAWLVSHDWTRVLAVLVVATPCPLILAAPVAIIGGINRAARRAIIVRHGGALEGLAKVDTAVFDKTGTLTVGKPQLSAVVPTVPSASDVHVAGVGCGRRAGLGTSAGAGDRGRGGCSGRVAADGHRLHETAGRGVTGMVNGELVAVGSPDFVREQLRHGPPAGGAGIGRDGRRCERPARVRGHRRRRGGAHRVRRSSCGRSSRPCSHNCAPWGCATPICCRETSTENVRVIAAAVGITNYAGDLTAQDKVVRVAALEKAGRRVLMVGDGTNDAPSLSTATVGMALAGHGGGVVAEAADVVLLVDDPGAFPRRCASGGARCSSRGSRLPWGSGSRWWGWASRRPGCSPRWPGRSFRRESMWR
jgi:cation transport ATPase